MEIKKNQNENMAITIRVSFEVGSHSLHLRDGVRQAFFFLRARKFSTFLNSMMSHHPLVVITSEQFELVRTDLSYACARYKTLWNSRLHFVKVLKLHVHIYVKSL